MSEPQVDLDEMSHYLSARRAGGGTENLTSTELLVAECRRLRAALADLDNPGNLELILDHKKLCYSECKTWCERCMPDTARRLVKACLALRAQVATLQGAIASQDRREREAGDKCGVSYLEQGCDLPDRMADVVVSLRAQVAEQAEQIECVEKTLTHNQGIITAMGQAQANQSERIAALESDLKACEEAGDEATAVYHSNETLRAKIAAQEAEIHALQKDVLPAAERFAEKVFPKPLDNGEIWSAIRGRLSYVRESLKSAVEAEKYETESAYFDVIARALADAVTERMTRADRRPDVGE